MKVTILRLSHGEGIIGACYVNGMFLCFSLELSWRNNEPEVSCIPAGVYKAVRHTSPKFGETYLLVDVPKRSEILFHAGNSIADTKGCILLGDRPRSLTSEIWESRDSVHRFLLALNGHQEITVEVKYA